MINVLMVLICQNTKELKMFSSTSPIIGFCEYLGFLVFTVITDEGRKTIDPHFFAL